MIGACKFKVHKYLKYYIPHQILVGSANSVVLYADFFLDIVTGIVAVPNCEKVCGVFLNYGALVAQVSEIR
jgi:hypothetical protein